MGPHAVKDPVYVCGHASDELDRLQLQAAFFEDMTRTTFQAAGLQAGFRVLDIGCGAGDVSFLAADIVRSTGSVVGVDRSPDAIARARRRTHEDNRTNVTFRIGPIGEIADLGQFDALVGRFVLMHQADPATTLRACVRHVRPAGLVIILESAMSACVAGVHSSPHSPTYDRITGIITTTLAAAGADVSMGFRLHDVFERAGLPRPTMRLQARVEGGPDAPIYRYISDSLRSVLPAATRLASSVETLHTDRLEDELRAEVLRTDGVLVSPLVIAAWTSV